MLRLLRVLISGFIAVDCGGGLTYMMLWQKLECNPFTLLLEELAFIEWICFAILIGLSADFVIHLSHAYTHLPGEASKEERTRYSLTSMGSAIMGATMTTFAVAFMIFFARLFPLSNSLSYSP